MNIWQQLREKSNNTGRAFTVLAPMEDVTDIVFRDIVLQEGRPDLFMTEFTSTDGLASKGRDKVIHRLAYSQAQKPIVAQIWGSNAITYPDAIQTIADRGFDGIDINMGCPVPNVIKRNAGGGAIRAPQVSGDIIKRVRDTIDSLPSEKHLSFSVKTRIGFGEIQLDWIAFLLQQPIDALTIHLRTVKELSKVPAHWELMKDIVAMRDAIAPQVVLIGNGDISTRDQIDHVYSDFGAEGVMIGRGIFENIWLFTSAEKEHSITREYRLKLLLRHIDTFTAQWVGKKNLQLLKKFFKIYLKDFEDAASLRKELIQMPSIEAIRDKLLQEV